MRDRIILHIDINHCFAQIEEMMNPCLREVPMCVGGDEASRSGIVLARNQKAKDAGVQTAETLRDAFRKCPNLVVVPPHYRDYMYYTTKVKEIYRDYTDKVESYGSDEAWIDITESYQLFTDKPYDLAYEMQNRVLEEYGLTVSVGVSWNKVFAKLASDYIKPSGMTIVTRSNFKDIVWPLAVGDLLYVGKQTVPRLTAIGIHTIGDLAQAEPQLLQRHFGVKGLQMWRYANGLDDDTVDASGYVEPPKSIGNSTTPPHDLVTLGQTKIILQHLCDSVATRLRDEGKRGYTVAIAPRDVELQSFTRQRRLAVATDVSSVILNTALSLLESNYGFEIPLRSIGVSVSNLVDAELVNEQINLFDTITKEESRQDTIDKTISDLRERFGYHVIKRASATLDRDTENFDARRDNVMFPGRKKDLDIDE